MNVLVVVGAGFIGSHMVKYLLAADHDVVVVDNLSTGHRDALLGGELVEMDVADAAQLEALFASRHIDAVMHFASFIEVGESVRLPAKYYANNMAATLALLEAMRKAGIDRLVFSSSAAVYGAPACTPIKEEHPKAPINPYGRSKWIVEQMLEDFGRAHGLKSVSLRYFNAAGAAPDGSLGERHEPETHLIPLALQVASGRRGVLTVLGRDYDTPDGTCVRDYVHVSDLVDAHSRALDYLTAGGASAAFNLGNGNGFSVQQVVDATERVTGCTISRRDAPCRHGDAPVLVADASLARRVLGWQPRYADLDTMIAHAWRREQASFAAGASPC